MSLERLEVGELPGGDLNEVQHEACDPRELRAIEELPGGGLNEVPREARVPRELRAVHCAQQVLVTPKDSSCPRGDISTRVPTSTCQYPSHNPLLPGEHRDGARRAAEDCQGRHDGELRDVGD